MDIMDTEGRANFIGALRQLADYLERNPGLPIGKWNEVKVMTSSSEMDPVDATSPTHVLRRMKEPGLMVKKDHYGDTVELSVGFGEKGYWGHPAVYSTRFEREAICTAKVVGTEERKTYEYTDTERAAALKAELEELRKVELVPVVEYDCAPILKA